MTREVVSSKICGKINGALLFVCHLRFSFKSCLIKIPPDIFHFALHFSVSSWCSHLKLTCCQAKLLIEETIRRNQSPVPREEMLVTLLNLDIICNCNSAVYD